MNRWLKGSAISVLILLMLVAIWEKPALSQTPKPTPAVGKPLEVSFLGPLSGYGAKWGQPTLYAIQLWADDENAKGGILVDGVRHRIEVIGVDCKGAPEVGRAGAEKLIYRDKVKIILGINMSHVFLACNPLFIKEGILTMSMASTDKVTGPDSPFSFRAQYDYHGAAEALLRWFKENKGVKKMYYLMKNYESGIVGRDKRKTLCKEIGMEWNEGSFEEGTTDFYPVITRAVAAKPDIVCLDYAAPGEAGLLVKALNELGFKGVVYSEAGLTAASVIAAGGIDNVQGFYFSGALYAGDLVTPETKALAARYEKKHGAGSWDALPALNVYAPYMLGQAMREAGSIDDIPKIVKALENIKFMNPWIKGNPVITYGGLKSYGIRRTPNIPAGLLQIQGSKELPVAILDTKLP
jgi:branched-chain amino acid transport system substrate-binding protein